jgi:23S rRNA (uracil1939-C5)-methyltransferase
MSTNPSHQDVTIERLVAGGDGLGRLSDGRVVFVPGTIGGERVTVELTRNKKDLAHGRVVTLLAESADRVAPPCPRIATGCGGCDWQHLSVTAQHHAKVVVAQDALTRTARMPELAARLRFGGSVSGSAGSAAGGAWRTTVRAAVNGNGRAGFFKAGSHDICTCGPCMVAHPVVADVLDRGDFSGNDEVIIRVSVSAKQLVVAAQDPRGVRLPAVPQGWSAELVQIPEKGPTQGGDGVITEVVDGQPLRVSIGSFFQSGPLAAQLLVDTVREMLSRFETPDAFIDLYGGVGLFAATLGQSVKTVVVVESSPSSVDDAMYNLPDPSVTVHKSLVEEWEPPRNVRRAGRVHVVADPARAGLGKDGVAVVLGCQPEAIVLVSCDAAAGARDARLLVEGGYVVADACVLDLFPHTSHIEMVTLYVPAHLAAG